MSKTLADILAANENLYVNCAHPMCGKSTMLDVQALIDRLGPDHGAMHQDLVGLFACAKCKVAGRERRPVFFTSIPDYEGQQRQRNPRLEADFRSHAKQTEARCVTANACGLTR